MELLFLLLPPVMATVKAAMQADISKNNTKTASDIYLFNSLIFILVSFVMSALFFRAFLPAFVLLWSVGSAVSITVFQVFYSLAFRCGSVSLASIINIFVAVGIVLMCASLVFIPRQQGGKINIKWFLFSVLAFLGAGMNNVIQLCFSKNGYGEFKEELIVFAYLFSSLFAFVVFLFSNKKGSVFKIDLKVACFTPVMGLMIGLYNIIVVWALSSIESYVFFPVVSLLSIIFITFFDVIKFKQKFSSHQIIGIALGVCAIVILNIK